VARSMVVEQQHPLLGTIRLPNLPFRFSDCDTSPRSVAPLLGQHNREIAAELGYGGQQIEALVADGVLYAEADTARLSS
jgi:crotonobetainyl-CoA:carnitine CoA-transferase CaiB-like acyl-CoA transferase